MIQPAALPPGPCQRLLAVLLLTFVAAAAAAATAPCRVTGAEAGFASTCIFLDSSPAAAAPAMCFGIYTALGANARQDSATPLPVVLPADATVIAGDGSSSKSISCFVTTTPADPTSRLSCTGSTNIGGTLGCGPPCQNSSLFPVPVAAVFSPTTDVAVAGVAVGTQHTVAWLADGTVWAAGTAPANGQSRSTSVFQRVSGGLSQVTSCAAGIQHTCCISGSPTNNKVFCWGSNEFGQLGDISQMSSATPVEAQSYELAPGAVKAVAAGSLSTVVLLQDGRVASWGTNQWGLGDGDASTQWSDTPVIAAGLSDARQIAAGGVVACAVDAASKVRCWGANNAAQLGVGAAPNCARPGGCAAPQPPVPNLAGVASVSVGPGHVCARLVDSTVMCWGAGDKGQLSGTFTGSATPRTVMCPIPDCAGNPPTQPNAQPFNCANRTHEAKCSASCSSGFSGGPVTSTCTAGVWSTPEGTCSPPPPNCVGNPPTQPNAQPFDCANRTAGARCSASCSSGFGGGSVSSTCVAGAWSTPAGTCSPQACSPLTGSTAPPHSSWSNCGTAVGDKCSATCGAGYECFHGVCPHFLCVASVPNSLAGTWSGPFGGCEVQSCPGLPPGGSPAHASGWSCSASGGGVYTCQAACDPGFSGFPALPVASCVTGSKDWTFTGGCVADAVNPAKVCLVKPSDAVDGGVWPDSCNNVPDGGSCVADCLPGLTGSLTVSCLGNAWSPVTGAPCVNNSISLQPVSDKASVCFDSSGSITASFTYTAPAASSTTFKAAVNFGTAPCSDPAPLAGPQIGTTVVVACKPPAGGFTIGLHSITLTASASSSPLTPPSVGKAVADVVVRPPPELSIALESEPAPVCKTGNQASGEGVAAFSYQVTASPDSGSLNLTATATTTSPGITCSAAIIPPNAAAGLVLVSCLGPFQDATPVSVSLVASQPACREPVPATAAATFTTKCCTVLPLPGTGTGGPSGTPAVARFQSASNTCTPCRLPKVVIGTLAPTMTNIGIFYAQTGREGSMSGPLVTGFDSSCAGGTQELPGTRVSVSCQGKNLFFNVTAPAFSSVQAWWLVRCERPNIQQCAFTSLASKWNNPVYKRVQVVSDESTSVSWQVPLSNLVCTCNSASVAVRVSGVIVHAGEQC